MADTQKTTRELNLTMGFKDGDDRILKVDNPLEDESQLKTGILALQSDMVTNQQLIGDKAGAEFTGFKKAETVDRTVTHLDLED